MAYRAQPAVPPLVLQAQQQAERLGFGNSSLPAVGRLLQVLAAQVSCGPVGEIGTGCGVGTAWMASGLSPQIPLYTVEMDPVRAEAASLTLAGMPNLRVLQGDWAEILPHGPFRMLFADTKVKEEAPERLLAALAPGGLLVLDDLTPAELWPPAWQGKRDLTREFWLNDARVRATEIRVTAESAVILAVRMA
jgi:predicted O-methyltransferase YrrM